MRAFKVCRVVAGVFDELPDMEIKICAAADKDAAKAKFDGNGYKVIEVVDVTSRYTLNPNVIADALAKVRKSDGYSIFDEWYTTLLASLISQSYENTEYCYSHDLTEGEYW